MNQIKDLPPSLFQNLQNLKQLWETHSALQYLWCKLCCVIHLYNCADLPSDLLIGWKPLWMNHRSILWTLSITIVLFVCVFVIEISPTIPWHTYTAINLTLWWICSHCE